MNKREDKSPLYSSNEIIILLNIYFENFFFKVYVYFPYHFT